MVGYLGCMQQSLGGDAAVVQARAAQLALLHQTNGHTQLDCSKCSCVTAAATAENQNIEFLPSCLIGHLDAPSRSGDAHISGASSHQLLKAATHPWRMVCNFPVKDKYFQHSPYVSCSMQHRHCCHSKEECVHTHFSVACAGLPGLAWLNTSRRQGCMAPRGVGAFQRPFRRRCGPRHLRCRQPGCARPCRCPVWVCSRTGHPR